MKSPIKITTSSSLTNQIPRCIAVVTAATHILIALGHGGPVAVPDVSAYLSIAQWVHGGIRVADNAFHPGYGLLLAPLGLLPGETLHTCALMLNALLAGSAVILAARIARRWDAKPQIAVLFAAVAAIHPTLSASSRIALPETLLIVTICCLVLLVDHQRWAVAGLVAGLSVIVHPRQIVAVVAVALTAALWGKWRPAFSALAAGVSIAIVGIYITDTLPDERIRAVSNISDGPNPIMTGLGQWIALAAGSAGIAAIGTVAAFSVLRSKKYPASFQFLAFGLSGMLLLGGVALAGSSRPDTLLYGRYIGLWGLPLILVGLLALDTGMIRNSHVLWVSIITSVAAAFVVFGVQHVEGEVRRIMTLDSAALWALAGHQIRWGIMMAALFGVGMSFLAVSRPGAAISVLLVICVSSSVLNHRHLHRVGQISEQQAATAVFLPEETRCLSHDSSVKSYALWLYRLHLPDIRHERIDVTTGEVPCDGYLIASTASLSNCINARLIAEENRGDWGLWKYPTQGCS